MHLFLFCSLFAFCPGCLGLRAPKIPAPTPLDAGQAGASILAMAEQKIYRPSRRIEELQCDLRITAAQPDSDVLPSDLRVEAVYTLRADLRDPDAKSFSSELLSLATNPPGLELPEESRQLLRASIGWAIVPFYPMPDLSSFARSVDRVENEGGHRKLLFRAPAAATDDLEQIQPRALWLDAQDRVAAFEFEERRSLQRMTYEWEPVDSPAGSSGPLYRLRRLQVDRKMPSGEGNQSSEILVDYAEVAEAGELPARVEFRSRYPGGNPGRSLDFVFTSYRTKKRK